MSVSERLELVQYLLHTRLETADAHAEGMRELYLRFPHPVGNEYVDPPTMTIIDIIKTPTFRPPIDIRGQPAGWEPTEGASKSYMELPCDQPQPAEDHTGCGLGDAGSVWGDGLRDLATLVQVFAIGWRKMP